MVLLEELYRENRQRLYAVAYAILHQPEEAEDTVHDTFVRLAENRHRLHLHSGEESRALLTAIARNAATADNGDVIFTGTVTDLG